MGQLGELMGQLGGLGGDESYELSDSEDGGQMIEVDENIDPEEWKGLIAEVTEDAALANADEVESANEKEEQRRAMAAEIVEALSNLEGKLDLSQVSVQIKSADEAPPALESAQGKESSLHIVDGDVLKTYNFLQQKKDPTTVVLCPFPDSFDDAELEKTGLFGCFARNTALLQVLRDNNVPAELPQGSVVLIDNLPILRNAMTQELLMEPNGTMRLILATPVLLNPVVVPLAKPLGYEAYAKLQEAVDVAALEQQVATIFGWARYMGSSILFPPFGCGRAGIPPHEFYGAIFRYALGNADELGMIVTLAHQDDEFTYLAHNLDGHDSISEQWSVTQFEAAKKARNNNNNNNKKDPVIEL